MRGSKCGLEKSRGESSSVGSFGIFSRHRGINHPTFGWINVSGVVQNQGVGRFTKIGIPEPGPMAHFVAILEIVGGLLLVSGFLTRLIAIPFVIEMSVLFRRNSESPAIRRIKIVQDGADSGGLKSQSTVVLNLTVLLLF
jgi:uncharacterized membrane protein YphA (DoxX/SURF4 family)